MGTVKKKISNKKKRTVLSSRNSAEVIARYNAKYGNDEGEIIEVTPFKEGTVKSKKKK
jgi:hypothetical protein